VINPSADLHRLWIKIIEVSYMPGADHKLYQAVSWLTKFGCSYSIFWVLQIYFLYIIIL